MFLFVFHPTAELEQELVDRNIDAEDVRLVSKEIQKKDNRDENNY